MNNRIYCLGDYLHMDHYLLGISCQKTIKYFAMFHKELIINQPAWSAEGAINRDITNCPVIRALDSKYYHIC